MRKHFSKAACQCIICHLVVNILHFFVYELILLSLLFPFSKKKNLEKKYEERTGLTSPETVENYKGTKDVFSFFKMKVEGL